MVCAKKNVSSEMKNRSTEIRKNKKMLLARINSRSFVTDCGRSKYDWIETRYK